MYGRVKLFIHRNMLALAKQHNISADSCLRYAARNRSTLCEHNLRSTIYLHPFGF